MCYEISPEIWKLYDRMSTRILVQQGVLPAEELALVAPPPPVAPEQQAAAEAAEQARQRIGATIRGLYKQRVARAASCGHGASLHMRRTVDGKIQDILVRPHCGRSACPFCWRYRLVKTLRRAANRLLDAERDGEIVPRIEMLHIGQTSWDEWDAFDKRMRRAQGGDCGRLRVRQEDNAVVVIAEKPFPGSRPMPAAGACDLAAAAIARLHPGKHSYRQLGSWSDRKEHPYRLLGRHEHLDHHKVQRELRALGAKAERIALPSCVGLAWRAADENTADLLWMFALESVCPTIAQEDTDPLGGNPDSTQPEGGGSPFDDPARDENGEMKT